MNVKLFKNVADLRIEKSEDLKDENIHKHHLVNSIVSLCFHPIFKNTVAIAS